MNGRSLVSAGRTVVQPGRTPRDRRRLSTLFVIAVTYSLGGDAVAATAHPVQEGYQVASCERPLKRLH